jgi:hypothetical protein
MCCSPQLEAHDSRIIADSASGWRLMKPNVELSWPDVTRPTQQQQQQRRQHGRSDSSSSSSRVELVEDCCWMRH